MIPSGDEPSGTVTNIATGTGLTGGPITTTGTISIDTTTVAMKSDIPAAITESTVSGWGFTKNTGTITGVGNVTSGNVTVDSTPTANSTNLVTSGGVKTAVDAKQDKLVSGTSIKTVNSESLLGSGNIGVVSAIGTSGNNLTYTKNGTTSNVTVPYATKAEKDTAGLAFRDAYFRSGLMFSPTLSDFPRLYSTQTNNAFYALNKRKTVTATGFTAFNAASIFNNDGNTLVNYIPAAGTGVITIGSTTDKVFATYTYGKIYMRFYTESTKGKPSSVSIRAYGTKSGTVGWYNYAAGAPITTQYSTEATNVWYCDNTNIYNIKAWEITIVAHETLPTYLSEVVAIFNRSNGEVDQSAVTKFANSQTLYGEITIDNKFSTTGKATLDSLEITNASRLKGAVTADSSITAASFIKSGGTSSQFLKADGSVDSNTYITSASLPSAMSASEANTGTATTARTISASVLSGAIDNKLSYMTTTEITSCVNTIFN